MNAAVAAAVERGVIKGAFKKFKALLLRSYDKIYRKCAVNSNYKTVFKWVLVGEWADGNPEVELHGLGNALLVPRGERPPVAVGVTYVLLLNLTLAFLCMRRTC